MTNPVRLAALIRFHLAELASRNAHHEFEHLARHVARAQIYSNILPATGPVSAGGDRGRDFETFRSRITPHVAVGSSFAERSSHERQVVFACSLERRIEAKIRADLAKVISGGGANEIIYFCEANVPIGRRLKFIEKANRSGVELQIVDGSALAEWLAEPDIFWIAQEYLHIPAETTPDVAPDESYAEHKAAWRDRAVLPISRADFVAVKSGLRHATFNPDGRPDLTLWLSKMSGFLGEDAPRDLVRDASYEIAVASLRGRHDMTPKAALVADYFSDAEHHTSIGELTNAATLLTYCFGGVKLDEYRVPEADLYAIYLKLVSAIEASLAEEIGPGRRAGLLYVRGLLEHVPATPSIMPDLATAIAYWNNTLDFAESAPLYPIEAFSDYLVEVIKWRGDEDALLALASRADELLSRRMGNIAAGEKAIDRAFSLLERNEPAPAIRELHKAKTKWFSREQLAGTLRILNLLAEQYRNLGLAYAAKYHAMAAAFIARHEARGSIGAIEPTALLELMDAEDAAGNSFGFLQLFPVLFSSHVQHDDRPFDQTKHPRLHENMGQLAVLLGFLQRGKPEGRGGRSAHSQLARPDNGSHLDRGGQSRGHLEPGIMVRRLGGMGKSVAGSAVWGPRA